MLKQIFYLYFFEKINIQCAIIITAVNHTLANTDYFENMCFDLSTYKNTKICKLNRRSFQNTKSTG